MPEISYKIFDSLKEIDRRDWDAVFGDIPESYLFYQALANSGLSDFVFYYLVIYRGKEIVVIAPLFSADFNLDIAVEGRMRGIIKFIRKLFPRFLVLKTLFCGTPFGENAVIGIRQDFKNHPGLVLLLKEPIENFAGRIGAVLVLFKDFLSKSTFLLDALMSRGYAKVESFPAVRLNLNFSSFEDYLKSLGSSTRKNMRKKLKQASLRGKIEVKVVQEVDSQVALITRLYENTYHEGSTKFERLSQKFFSQIARDLYPHARFFLYYVDGKLAAFNLCFVYPDLLIDKFIGFDYDIANHCNLYFFSWAYNIQWCIDNSLRYYHPGQTDYEPKVRLGGEIVPLYAYLKHRKIFFNILLKLLILFFKPNNFDKDIRKREDV